MPARLITFLIRRKLGVKKFQRFRFKNQSNKDNWYFFNDSGLYKYLASSRSIKASHASLNWLLDDECEVEIIEGELNESCLSM